MHVPLSMPPKYPVCQVVEFINGRSAIQIARNFQGRKKNFVGQNFWARGYYVSTAGKDEEVVRAYIKAQEQEDQCLEQLNLFEERLPSGRSSCLTALSGSESQATGLAGGT